MIPLFKIYHDKEDVRAVTKVIESGEDWAIGPNIERLESRICEYLGVKYAAVFNSGTSALHALMLAHDIGPSDEVIVPSFTFIATANAPLFTGANPVFAEIEPQTYGLDPSDVERKITSRTKAIMPIHYGGCPCKISELKALAKKFGLLLIEDCAESFGAKIGDKKVGTFGDAAMFSFCASKVVTTGEGGAVVTNSRSIYEKLKLIRSHGREEDQNYFLASSYMDYVRLGFNFRMSNINAALGLAQLKKVDKLIKMRREVAEYFTNGLSLLQKKIELQNIGKDCFHVYQMYTVRIKNGRLVRDQLKDFLNKQGITAKVYFYPVHLTTFYKKNFGYRKGHLPLTEKISGEVLTLPMYPALSRAEVNFIINTIKKFFSNGNGEKE